MLLSLLEKGALIARRKRFFADVELPSGLLTAHCPNTGSMRSLLLPGTQAFVSKSDNPKRKLSHTLEILQLPDGTMACVNTQRANHQVAEAIRAGSIQGFPPGCEVQMEVPCGAQTRFDMRVTLPDSSKVWVEVKNVTLVEAHQPRVASFPDAVTERGAKHLRELADQVRAGHPACMFFLVNRDDADSFEPAQHIDLAYAEELKRATLAGVGVLVYRTSFSEKANEVEMVVKHQLPWSLQS